MFEWSYWNAYCLNVFLFSFSFAFFHSFFFLVTELTEKKTERKYHERQLFHLNRKIMFLSSAKKLLFLLRIFCFCFFFFMENSWFSHCSTTNRFVNSFFLLQFEMSFIINSKALHYCPFVMFGNRSCVKCRFFICFQQR